MIELTTGVTFLVSSLYGSGSVPAVHSANMAASQSDGKANTATAVLALKDTKDIENYVKTQYADVPILVDIARCESTFRQYDKNGRVVRGKVDKRDIGVMQINEFYQGDTAKKLGLDIYTVEGNVAYGKHLYQEQGTKPWASSKSCWGGELARR